MTTSSTRWLQTPPPGPQGSHRDDQKYPPVESFVDRVNARQGAVGLTWCASPESRGTWRFGGRAWCRVGVDADGKPGVGDGGEPGEAGTKGVGGPRPVATVLGGPAPGTAVLTVVDGGLVAGATRSEEPSWR